MDVLMPQGFISFWVAIMHTGNFFSTTIIILDLPTYLKFMIVIIIIGSYSTAGWGAEYCDECICLCLSTSVSPELQTQSSPTFLHVKLKVNRV